MNLPTELTPQWTPIHDLSHISGYRISFATNLLFGTQQGKGIKRFKTSAKIAFPNVRYYIYVVCKKSLSNWPRYYGCDDCPVTTVC